MGKEFLNVLLYTKALLVIFILECHSSEKKTKEQKEDVHSRFQKLILPILPEDLKRWYDCPENSDIKNRGLPMSFPNSEFNYFSSKKHPHLLSGLIEHQGYPILLSLLGPFEKPTQEPRVIVTFRGDTSGYHKSRLSKPYLNYMSTVRKKDIMFLLDQMIYRDEIRDIKKGNLIYICHSRKYLGTMMDANWIGIANGRGLELLQLFFSESQKFEVFSYSNGTLPRTELITRTFINGYKPNYSKVNDYPKFLKEYMENSILTYEYSKNIYGLLDIDGNYFAKKPLWDLLAFIKEVIDSDPNRYFYSIVSVLEHDAYPNHVIMIKALELTGKEDAEGVVRYSNFKQNVVIDVITSAKFPYYEGFGYNLEKMTKFTKHPAPKRLNFGHLQLIPFAMKRFENTSFHDSLKN